MSTKEKSVIKNPRLYRARLACRVGRDALDGKADLPKGVNNLDYAIYNLLHAVEDIAAEMEKQNEHA